MLDPKTFRSTKELWSVQCGSPWFAAPFDDLVEAADDAFSRQREVYLNTQTFAVEVVQDVQQPELPPSSSRSAMETMEQTMFGASGTVRASGLSRFNRLRGLILKFNSSSR